MSGTDAESRSSSEGWARGLVTATLICVGIASWSFQLRDPLIVDAEDLARLPLALQGWRGQDVPVEAGIAEMLNADFHVQRTYVHPVGGLLWLYVGYYGTDRGGRPEHTPWICYPSNGWEIVGRDVVKMSGAVGLRANELVVEKEGRRRLVHFWYQSSRRSGMLGGLDHALERLAGRLREGRADGALVRLSAPLESSEDVASVRARLLAMERVLVPLLGEHWPQEQVSAL